MALAYTIGIYLADVFLKVFGPFNSKLKAGVDGRRNSLNKLRNAISLEDKVLWFHCASLGEYEQGLPVFEKLKEKYIDRKIVLTFFSPSGYEVRKNAAVADVVVYLPLDTPRNAKRFLDIVNPELVIFVKYEFWPNLLFELKKRQTKTILISASFRKNQIFFKWYGSVMRKALKTFDFIFTQNESSKNLLDEIDFKNVAVSGDTRFDRVSNQLEVDNSVAFISDFVDHKTCMVFGSTWPDDDKLYLDYINSHNNDDLKFIIAPHNVKSSYVSDIKKQLQVPTICYSELRDDLDLGSYKVFVLDTIGYLTKVYSYADIAYVGGAAGTTGLHNILEPAAFGIPILIGKNYTKFPEAHALIELGGVISIHHKNDFIKTMDSLLSEKDIRLKKGEITKNFISNGKGAVVQILDYIRI